MQLLFKLTSLFIAAAGAAIALFGESRNQGQLTSLGKLSLALLIIGFLATVIVEFIEHKEQSVNQQWTQMLQQPIYQIMVEINYNKPMSVSDFCSSLLDSIRFVFGTYAQLESDKPLVRYLGFNTDRSKSSNVERAITLCVKNRKAKVIERSDPGTLVYRTEQHGTFRNYVQSIDKKWDSWELPTVGIRIRMPFYKLGLGENIRTIGDLAKLTSLAIYLPQSLSRQDVDAFSLIFFYSG